MLTLPFTLTRLIVGFAPLFSKPVWKHVQVLLVGTILAPGQRSVTSALRVMGLSGEKHFQTYHRVLNRAVWSSREASRILLGLLVCALVPEGALVFAIDDTIERRRGEQIKAKGIYRDPSARRTRTSSQRAAGAGSR
jgi:hypothetical protein